MAECSESTGIIFSAPNFITRSPPATKDSLLASATLFPTPRAESVGPKPIDPVMPFKTMSQGRAAISIDELSPSITCTPAVAGAGAIEPTIGTLNFFACAINNCGFLRPPLKPTKRNLFGWAAAISRACTPIDPVEPKTTTSRICLS